MIGIGLSLSSWIAHLDRDATTVPFVTVLEIFVGFHLFTGLIMPLQISRHGQRVWMPIDSVEAGEDPVVGLWPRMCVLFLFC